ncbi:MAG: lmo0937 family membrane protein [Patescibacteria group bacterium]
MLWTVAVIFLVLWLLGFSFKIGGNLVHTLLVIALIVIVVRLLS